MGERKENHRIKAGVKRKEKGSQAGVEVEMWVKEKKGSQAGVEVECG